MSSEDYEQFEIGNIVTITTGRQTGQKVKVFHLIRYNDGSTYMEGEIIETGKILAFTESNCTKVLPKPGVDCVF